MVNFKSAIVDRPVQQYKFCEFHSDVSIYALDLSCLTKTVK